MDSKIAKSDKEYTDKELYKDLNLSFYLACERGDLNTEILKFTNMVNCIAGNKQSKQLEVG